MAERRKLWLIVGGALVAVLAIGALVAWNFHGSTPAAQPPVTSPTTAPTDVPTPTSAPSNTPSDTVSASPSPLVSRTTVKSKSPYCQTYQVILDTAPSSEPTDEEGGADLKKLSDSYAALITKYTAAGKLAPPSLKDDYAKVIRYLRDFKITVDTGDWNAVRAQLRVLFKLNDAMDSIQTESDRICN